ncbi:MAG: PIN domain-containing protein [Bryobacterales bacterium]|nr:PIN domain-containing protein [Bryobacterales bacterium]
MPAFWDTSALVRVCIRGQNSARARQLLRADTPVAWWLTPVEVRSALSRLQREGAISAAASRVAWERSSALLAGAAVVQPTDALKDTALAVLDRFPLKTGDALQLAAALVWCRRKPRGRWFVCNDRQLAASAEAAGFTVESV